MALLNRPLKDIDFAIIDIETTGLSTTHDIPVEIAAVKTRNGKVVGKFHSLIYVSYIPFEATMIHGIDTSMVKNAPRLNVVRSRFKKFIKGCTLVGHNIRKFDLKFLCKYFKLSKNTCCVDTIYISKKLFPMQRKHNLKAVAKRLGMRNNKYHRALNDATTTRKVFTKLLFIGKNRFNFLRELLLD